MTSVALGQINMEPSKEKVLSHGRCGHRWLPGMRKFDCTVWQNSVNRAQRCLEVNALVVFGAIIFGTDIDKVYRLICLVAFFEKVNLLHTQRAVACNNVTSVNVRVELLQRTRPMQAYSFACII